MFHTQGSGIEPGRQNGMLRNPCTCCRADAKLWNEAEAHDRGAGHEESSDTERNRRPR